MNQDIHPDQSLQYGTTLPRHLGSEHPLTEWPSNLYEWYPVQAQCPGIVFGFITQHLLGDHTRFGATSSTWLTETAVAVTIGHGKGASMAWTLEHIHQGKGLCVERFYLILQPVHFSHFWRSFEVGDAGQSCAGNGLTNDQNDLPAQIRVAYLTWLVLDFIKHTHLPEAETFFSKCAYAATVMAGRWQKALENSGKDKMPRPGRYSFIESTPGTLSAPTWSYTPQLSNPGPFDQLPLAVLENLTSTWSISVQGTCS